MLWALSPNKAPRRRPFLSQPALLAGPAPPKARALGRGNAPALRRHDPRRSTAHPGRLRLSQSRAGAVAGPRRARIGAVGHPRRQPLSGLAGTLARRLERSGKVGGE